MQDNAHHLDKNNGLLSSRLKFLEFCIETFVLCTVLFALLFVIFNLFIDL